MAPDGLTLYFVRIDSSTRPAARDRALGGKLLVGPFKLPTGSFAWFADPEGNTVGLWQQG